MVQKLLDVGNLYRDLGYALAGTPIDPFLEQIAPRAQFATTLEPGCGSGKLSIRRVLGTTGKAILFDVDDMALIYAQRIANAAKAITGLKGEVDIRKGSVFGIPGEDERADLVFNEGVIQHWRDESLRQDGIDEMARVCKSGGIVCVIGNNGHSPEEQETDEVTHFGYEGMPDKRKCFTAEELKMRLGWAELKDVRVGWIRSGGVLSEWAPGVEVTESNVLIAGWGRKP